MKDGCERNIDYLRVSVTDRCNLRCLYCMPESGVKPLGHGDILTYEEILCLGHIASALGIRKIKITGGEPLVRKNVDRLIAGLKAIDGIDSVTLTTNGVLLKSQLPKLLEAGLDAVNLSLDTMDEEKYRQVTRIGSLKEALEGLEAVLSARPSIPVKINCVPYFSDRENIVSMAGLAKTYPVHVRFIEMMPIGLGSCCEPCREDRIRQILTEAYGPLKECTQVLGNGPCRYFSLPGFSGKIGFISALSHKFCGQCNRVRLTADGYLKTCLQYDTGADLKALLRGGADDEALAAAMRAAIADKPKGHHFGAQAGDVGQKSKDEHLSMYQIGG